jgi:hypothetical protein
MLTRRVPETRYGSCCCSPSEMVLQRNGFTETSKQRLHLFLDTEHKVKAIFQPPFPVTYANSTAGRHARIA